MALDARTLVPIVQQATQAAADAFYKAMEEQGITDKFSVTIKLKHKKGSGVLEDDVSIST